MRLRGWRLVGVAWRTSYAKNTLQGTSHAQVNNGGVYLLLSVKSGLVPFTELRHFDVPTLDSSPEAQQCLMLLIGTILDRLQAQDCLDSSP